MEDYERQHKLDKMYLIEHMLQIEEEWWQYEEEHNRQPAIIEIEKVKIVSNGRDFI